ncbi:MAG: chloride channel protein [Bacteroidia bacterium]|nr:chloride channel protein [Bacteroidia bacterium]
MYQFIKKNIQRIAESLSESEAIRKTLQTMPYWIASVVVGFVAVAYARIFHYVEIFNVYWMKKYPVFVFFVTPFCFLVGWWVVRKFAPYAKGSGIPQVMASLELASPRHIDKVDKLLNFKIIIVKIISSVVILLGGGAVGREGSTIQISAAIFRIINKYFPQVFGSNVSKKIMIMTGAASGLAAAFNTPLGGIVFAIEELSKTHFAQFRTAVFTSVIIAGLTAQTLIGSYLYLDYPPVNRGVVPFTITLLVLLTGILGGVFGAVFGKTLLWVGAWKKKLKKNWQHVVFIILAGWAVAALIYFVSTDATGSGKDAMMRILFGKSSADRFSGWELFPLRFFGPVLSYSVEGAGGVFAPSLSAGASFGALMAHIFEVSPENFNFLVLAGMVAFLTGVTRAPFTSAILVLEMSDRYSTIFYLILAGLASSSIAFLIDKKSMYEVNKTGFIDRLIAEEEAEYEALKKSETPGEESSSRR